MDSRDPPTTAEGWYALHDFRSIDWDGWADTPDRTRDRLLDEAQAFLTDALDTDAGQSAIYTIVGADADLLIVHLRPTTADIDALDRATQRSTLGRLTDRVDSFVSVTEASGYSDRFEAAIEGTGGEGIQSYVDSRLYPTIPDAEHVVFYPMDKRRDPEQNWYDLPFEERSAHMEQHGEIGRKYAGKVTQMITGAIGFDDHEWGVTLWADDLTDVKDLLYEMRFDPSTSQFAEFGPFFVGRKIEPSDLPAVFAGDRIAAAGDSGAGAGSTGADDAAASGSHGHHESDAGSAGSGPHGHGGEADGHPGGDTDAHGSDAHPDGEAGEHPSNGGDGRPETVDDPFDQIEATDDIEAVLVRFGVDPPADGGYVLALTADADASELNDAVAALRSNFDHYDSHLGTYVRASGGETRVISCWDAERAATTAAGFLLDLDGVTGGVRGPIAGTAASATETADLDDLDVFAGRPRDDEVTALVAFSEADPDALADALTDQPFADRAGHHETTVYREHGGGSAAVVTLWDELDDAGAVADALDRLPGVEDRPDDGYTTLGLFYRVQPDHREEFVATFETVGETLAEMDGHRESRLMIDVGDDTNTFIDSRWTDRESALEFFRSEAFRETVAWGREVLADQPRHVVLADPE
ncbi:heme-binding protein [Halococcoides cellulosivorans]|uniref:Heme-dependent peroxidase n=1 Tax=Halococcoides cellulosivorans TaxID=1679096 RepID=A0A2R4X1Y5_9EURY|nr:heme-binding protein [Halococcoides cellulosivorans]AWB27812.1 heme-dependent peroxidase [Halococcoides cellulosivorans]